jgi:hypothetical protein
LEKIGFSTIKLLLKNADGRLKNLDKLMLGYKSTDSALYSKYNAVRTVYDKHGVHRTHNHTTVKAVVRS